MPVGSSASYCWTIAARSAGVRSTGNTNALGSTLALGTFSRSGSSVEHAARPNAAMMNTPREDMGRTRFNERAQARPRVAAHPTVTGLRGLRLALHVTCTICGRCARSRVHTQLALQTIVSVRRCAFACAGRSRSGDLTEDRAELL